jgi:hypothetical protein
MKITHKIIMIIIITTIIVKLLLLTPMEIISLMKLIMKLTPLRKTQIQMTMKNLKEIWKWKSLKKNI